MILCTFGKSMVSRQFGQPAIRLFCYTRKDTIPGLVEEYSCYDSLHFWGKVWLIETLDSLLYVCVANFAEIRYLDL